MSGGPQNFLSRVNKELDDYDLKNYKIFNPNGEIKSYLDKDNLFKVARMDGALYYKSTSNNLYNLVLQRYYKYRKFFKLLKYLPNSSTMIMNCIINNYLNRNSKQLQEKSDIVIFQSKLSMQMQEKFVGSWFKKKPYTIIPNGIPLDIFNPNTEKINLEGYPKLVITASFRLHKRLQDAIRLTNSLKISKYPNIKLHVIGDMDILTKNMLKNLDITNIVLHGRVDSELLPKFYNSCDVGLSPSMFDPCPNSVVEMMGCGLPVITVKESGASELIQVDDLIIEENLELKYYELQTLEKLPQIDIQKWSIVIEKVLNNYKSYKEKVLNIVQNQLDIKIIAKQYVEFIGVNSGK